MERSFSATIDSLEGIFAFAEEFFTLQGIDPEHHFAVNFALEEIFTNVVKYSSGGSASKRVRIGLTRTPERIQVRVVASDVGPFDPTEAPEPNVDAPLEARKVGGLGLFLTKKVMDTMEYEYADRTSTITLTKKLG